MLSYYLKCRKNTENKNQKVAKANKERIMLLSKYAVCDREKSRNIKEQEASGLLGNLRLKQLKVKFHYFVIFCFKCIK